MGCECILGNHLRYLILLVSSRNLHFSCPKKIVMAILGSDAVRSRAFWLNCSEFFNRKGHTSVYNGILLPKLFWLTVRKSCSSDQEKLLDLRLKKLRFLLRTIYSNNSKMTVDTIFETRCFLTCSWRILRSNMYIWTIQIQIGKEYIIEF